MVASPVALRGLGALRADASVADATDGRGTCLDPALKSRAKISATLRVASPHPPSPRLRGPASPLIPYRSHVNHIVTPYLMYWHERLPLGLEW
jgi:hypothetical protein